MKLYAPPPPAIVLRVRIIQFGDFKNAKYLTICGCTQDEALQEFKEMIESQKLSPFQKGKAINIEVREAIGAKNGKSKSISFKGLTVEETYHLIQKYIYNQQNNTYEFNLHQNA